jgi:hypothetical protein
MDVEEHPSFERQLTRVPPLMEVTPFAMGPAGEAGITSEGELALRAAVASTNAYENVQRMLLTGGTTRKLYALCAIHKLWPQEFNRAAQGVDPEAKVLFQAGCIIQEQTAKELLSSIAAGNYDSFISPLK